MDCQLLKAASMAMAIVNAAGRKLISESIEHQKSARCEK
jgi:hypothetical protein